MGARVTQRQVFGENPYTIMGESSGKLNPQNCLYQHLCQLAPHLPCNCYCCVIWRRGLMNLVEFQGLPVRLVTYI